MDFDTGAIVLNGVGANIQRPFYEFTPNGLLNLWVFTRPPFPSSDNDPILSNLSFSPSGADGAVDSWTAFDGVDPNGKWRITIRDLASGDDLDSGQIQGFELILVTANIPEPATWGLMAGALGILIGRHRRAH